ncbi:MAG: DNA polymerase I [Chromatiales bacterium]|jgi:DNA polymerase-1|nr:DNA polymerase I [Chromatiales bacterium]
MSKQQSLLLVDGSSYLYRAFHAAPPLNTRSGQPTGAIHVMLNMLHKTLREENTDLVAIIMDAPGKNFRHDMYSDYKANRPPMPDDLRLQVDALNTAIELSGLPFIRVPGVEADDVIGTLATQATAAGISTIISTGDKDMAQLVNSSVSLIDTMHNPSRRTDIEGVKKKFDVTPEQIIDYLALIGDTSDNVPGIPKCGPKTAAKWLNEYGTLDKLVAHAGDIGGKIGESLRDHLEQLKLSRRLVTIDTAVELAYSPGSLAATKPDNKGLQKLYEELELKGLLKALGNDSSPAVTAPPDATHDMPAINNERKYETLLTQADFERWIKKIESATLTAFDTETTSINYMQAELVGISFAVEAGEAAYLPVGHSYAGVPEQLDRNTVLKRLKPWLESNAHKKVGHHLKYDAHILANYDIDLNGMAYDTMIESYVLNSTAGRHDLDSVALRNLGIKTIHYEDVAGKGAKQIGFNEVSIEIATPYASEDADICLQLHQHLWGLIDAIPALRDLYLDIEQPLVKVLQTIEETGVRIDDFQLAQQSTELEQKLQKIEEKAHVVAGHSFNLASPKQLQAILFEELELPVVRKTPKGQPSTAEDVLQELADDYELPRLILEHRGMAKLKSTYTDKLPGMISPRTGRIHTSYHQSVAATGRLSSSDPNLQNIPIRTEEGRRIRQAFIPENGYKLIAADYSQIELRIMAHISGDPNLLEAFANDKDVHQATAAEVFSVELEAVTTEQRRAAKAINFGLMYGMSAFGLAKQLGVGRYEAQDYIDTYFARYPGVSKFMERTRDEAKQLGYVETVFGRRLYLPEINDRNGQRRQYAERSAINAPMQGTAADIIKKAMLKVQNWLDEEHVDARIIMQVHDELVLETREACVDNVKSKLEELMSQAATLKVPLRVDVGVGDNWDQAH